MCDRLAAVLCALSACSLDVDYSGTLFACDADGACPAGFACQNQRCVPTEPQAAECALAVGAGDNHTCAIRSDGTAWCWGSNAFGQLGDGTTDDRITPVEVVPSSGAKLPRFTAIVGGDTHTCALGIDHTVWCWGHNDSGQLGNGGNGSTSDFHDAVQVSNLSGATAIASGAAHTCAIAGGSVSCWGNNAAGQIGNNGTVNVSQPQTVSGLSNVMVIAAGGFSTCAIDGQNQLWCWGDNGHGQLADGSRTQRLSPNPAMVQGAAGVAVGDGFSCVLAVPTSGGGVTCFGLNNIGQIGTPVDSGDHLNGSSIGFKGAAVSVVARTDFACLIDTEKQVWCWGDNEDFQLADATAEDRLVPVQTGFHDAAAVVAGGGHTCALSTAGGITCSGYNGRGQLGNGRRTSQATPHVVSGIQNAVAVSAGGFSTCATLADGTAMCWGGNDQGDLGDGTVISRSHPAPVSTLAGVEQLATGLSHACAVTQGTALCWGANNNGQLGDMTNYTRGDPLPVSGLTGVTQIDAGGNNTCAVAGGAVSCWGQGGVGQLGDGAPADVNAPVSVLMLKPHVSAVTVGDGHACAIQADTTVSCWGAGGGGQLGDGNFAGSSSLPVVASDLSGVDHVVAAAGFTCAHTADRNVWCWGGADRGALGFTVNHNVGTPTLLTTLTGATKVDAGGSHACAIKDSALTCWGANFFGEVGDGSHDDRGTPVALTMPGGVAVADVSAGEMHTCAALTDGSVTCWGDDRFGQLGDGVLADQHPVAPLLPCP